MLAALVNKLPEGMAVSHSFFQSFHRLQVRNFKPFWNLPRQVSCQPQKETLSCLLLTLWLGCRAFTFLALFARSPARSAELPLIVSDSEGTPSQRPSLLLCPHRPAYISSRCRYILCQEPSPLVLRRVQPLPFLQMTNGWQCIRPLLLHCLSHPRLLCSLDGDVRSEKYGCLSIINSRIPASSTCPFSATHRAQPLSEQKFFVEVRPLLVDAFHKAPPARQSVYLLALAHLLKHVTQPVRLSHAPPVCSCFGIRDSP